MKSILATVAFVFAFASITPASAMTENQRVEKLWVDAGKICARYVPAQPSHLCVPYMFSVIQNGPVEYQGRVIYKDGRFTAKTNYLGKCAWSTPNEFVTCYYGPILQDKNGG